MGIRIRGRTNSSHSEADVSPYDSTTVRGKFDHAVSVIRTANRLEDILEDLPGILTAVNSQAKALRLRNRTHKHREGGLPHRVQKLVVIEEELAIKMLRLLNDFAPRDARTAGIKAFGIKAMTAIRSGSMPSSDKPL